MQEKRIAKMETTARLILDIADESGWSEKDLTRQLARLALEAAQALRCISPTIPDAAIEAPSEEYLADCPTCCETGRGFKKPSCR